MKDLKITEKSKNMNELRRCKWFITLYEYDIEYIKARLKSYKTHLIIKHDKGYNPHWHIYVEHKNPIRYTTLKKHFPYSVLEVQRGAIFDVYNFLFHYDENYKYSVNDLISNLSKEEINNVLKI